MDNNFYLINDNDLEVMKAEVVRCHFTSLSFEDFNQFFWFINLPCRKLMNNEYHNLCD